MFRVENLCLLLLGFMGFMGFDLMLCSSVTSVFQFWEFATRVYGEFVSLTNCRVWVIGQRLFSNFTIK